MIEYINLKFGRAQGLEPESISITPVTVFVGPSNSGKSKILSEITQFCSSGQQLATNVIIGSIELKQTSPDKIDQKIADVTLQPEEGDMLQQNYIMVGTSCSRYSINKEQLKQAFLNPSNDLPLLCKYYLSFNTSMLSGRNRLNLVNQQPACDLKDPVSSSFQVLFRDDDKRSEVRRIVHESFGKYLVLDPTNLGQLNLRLSSIEPNEPMQERGIHEEAVRFHANALSITDASDGVKAFTGMVIEMIAGDPSILLVDEPEAFLHPSLSFKLGKEVSGIMSDLDKRLFVSTHSSNFLMGCIQAGTSINIIRLTYQNEIPTARILPNNDILKLMRNPLLRSAGVLSALFYEYVIVTESDADRAFYQEINDRLLKHTENKGISNCLFLHAQNKQTIKTIVKPLRELGIPVAGIVDIDIIKDGGVVWSNFLDSGFIPEIEWESLANLRLALKRKFEESGRNMKKDGGINLLDPSDKEAAESLFSKLGKYGLFTVSNGELESWLPELNATGHGPNWLVEIFEKMGEDPEDENYLKPTNSDVWKFIENIGKWLFNPRRKGIPS